MLPQMLLVGINSSWSQSTPALYYLRQMISGLPYRVEILEATLKDFPQDILRRIVLAEPDVIGFSAYIWNRRLLQTLIPACRKLMPLAVIVIGGPEAMRVRMPDESLLFRIAGSGEAAFKALAETGFKELPQVPLLPLANVPFPYTVTDQDRLQGKLVYYETYRGCPYHCIYCLSARDNRLENRFDLSRTEDRKRLDAELDMLLGLQPKTLKFVDRSFNAQRELAHYIWERIIRQDWPCDVHFEIYPDLLNEEDFRILERAPEGRIRFEIGVQTTNDVIAAACGRKSDWAAVRSAIQALKQRTKVRIHADLLAGLPGQDLSSVLDSVDELCAILPDAVQLGILKILPDTPMEDLALQKGYQWDADPPYQCLASDAMSAPDLWLVDDCAHLLNLYWNKEEFPAHWAKLLAKHQASKVLITLANIHNDKGYPLHSLAKAKRQEVMQKLTLQMEVNDV